MLLGRLVVLIVMYTCFSACLHAQEDLSRDNGLPNRIGGPNCPNAGRREVATVAGVLNVVGTIAAGANPRFSVALYAGGVFVGRQRLKNGASFVFYCVPTETVTLVGEVEGAEVSTFSLGHIAPAPAMNRQDVFINYAGERSDQPAGGVVSAHYAYERTKENQKQFDRALEEVRLKDNASAEKRLRKLVENDPKDFAAWTVLGEIYFNGNQFDEASKAFEQTLALKKDFTPAMLGMGRSLLGAKKFEEAVEVLKSAYALEPNSADTNHYLGEAYLQIRKGSLAIPHLNKAIELAPEKKADLHLRMAALYIKAGATQLAANEYKLFLQKKPDYADRKKMEAYIAENAKEAVN